MINSFKFAGEGLLWIVQNHRNFRIYLFVSVIVLLASIYFRLSRNDFIIVLFTTILCLMAEMLNTALEEVTNLITVKWSHQAKVVKDVAAAISLVSAIVSIIVGILIFVPYIGLEFT